MADANAFRLVAETILKDKDIKIIVVSAGGKTSRYKKTTDMLLDAYGALKGGQSPRKNLSEVAERVCELKRQLRLKKTPENELMKIENETDCGRAPDFLLSRGERIYSELFAEFIGMPFIDAKELYKFDENGNLNSEFTYYSLRRAFKEKGTFVTGGFYGEDENGFIRTFSRGGSDVSGAIAARAVTADVFLDYTDVNGVYKYDPRRIKNAKPVDELSYSQIRRLGEFGASVLHPDSVLPLSEKGIPAVIKNTFEPSAPGTRISAYAPSDVFAVAATDNLFYVRLEKPNCGKSIAEKFSGDINAVALTVTGDGLEAVCKERLPDKIGFGQEVGEYIENDVTLFYATAGDKGRKFISEAAERLKPLYFGSLSDGYFLAVRGREKAIIESVIEKYIV